MTEHFGDSLHRSPGYRHMIMECFQSDLGSHLSTRLGSEEYAVYLKPKNLQPSHSFKYCGIPLFVQRALVIHGPALRVLRASGADAGLATACAAQELGGPCTIFLPHGVDARTEAFLRTVGANVVVASRFYLETLRAAEVAVQMLPDTFVAKVQIILAPLQ